MTYTQAGTPTQASRGLAIGSLVAGILGLVLFAALFVAIGGMTPLAIGIVLGIVAVILGILAIKGNQSRAFAITGIVVGALTVVLGLALLLFALLFVGALGI